MRSKTCISQVITDMNKPVDVIVNNPVEGSGSRRSQANVIVTGGSVPNGIDTSLQFVPGLSEIHQALLTLSRQNELIISAMDALKMENEELKRKNAALTNQVSAIKYQTAEILNVLKGGTSMAEAPAGDIDTPPVESIEQDAPDRHLRSILWNSNNAEQQNSAVLEVETTCQGKRVAPTIVTGTRMESNGNEINDAEGWTTQRKKKFRSRPKIIGTCESKDQGLRSAGRKA